MSERSPELSPWEDMGPDSDDEQFYLSGKSNETEDDSEDCWQWVESNRNSSATQIATCSARPLQRQNCSHLLGKGCSLNASGQCCECSDKRPATDDGLYSMYVDGQGWVNGATRWAYYCPSCKDHQETAILNQVMEKLQKMAAECRAKREELAKSQCEHWLERGCSITNTGKCCACSDLRPGTRSQLYPAYIDGKGLVANVTRWAYYCPGCKKYESYSRPISQDNVVGSQAPANTAILAKDDEAQCFQSTTMLDVQADTRCPHIIRRGCSMTSTAGNCCACADQRPRSDTGLYATYIDGRGWVEGATRWAGYCPNCQKAYHHFSVIMRRSAWGNRTQAHMQRRIQAEEQAARPEESCEHWKARECSMTSNPKRCCSCWDKRPDAPSYSTSTPDDSPGTLEENWLTWDVLVYVDGRGWVMGAKRWAYYCPGCRNHHELSEHPFHAQRKQDRSHHRDLTIYRPENPVFVTKAKPAAHTGVFGSMSDSQPATVDQEVMSWLRLWHERMAHANLKAIVILGRQGDAGEIPKGLPKGPSEKFEGLQPYMDQFNCESCRQMYGNPSGPSSW
ncbi:putative Zinc-binding domain-containing protein [Seiridium cardinale]|uniref:Zinc-binding domain-containing protein n=1 Tax=Seiridium cardinale TaxID=138064 RepID=A0ABR2XW35_9PEZI